MTGAAPMAIDVDGRSLTAKKARREREKTARRNRTPEQRREEANRRKVREDAAKVRDAEARAARPVAAPPPAQPRRTLIHDDRAGTIERRRFDCAHLATCEDQWAATYHVAQAKCVTGCRGFERREFDRPISLGGSGVSLG